MLLGGSAPQTWPALSAFPPLPAHVPEPPPVPAPPPAGSRASRYALPPSFLPTSEEAQRVRHGFYDLEVSIGRFRQSRRRAFSAFLDGHHDYPVVLTDLPFEAAEQVLFAAVHYGPDGHRRDGRSVLGRLLHRLGRRWAEREAAAAGRGDVLRCAAENYLATAVSVITRVWAGQRVFECVYVGRDRAEQKFRDRRTMAWRPLSGGPDWTRGSLGDAFGPIVFCAQPYVSVQGPEEEPENPLNGPDSNRLSQWMLRRFSDAVSGMAVEKQRAHVRLYLLPVSEAGGEGAGVAKKPGRALRAPPTLAVTDVVMAEMVVVESSVSVAPQGKGHEAVLYRTIDIGAPRARAGASLPATRPL